MDGTYESVGSGAVRLCPNQQTEGVPALTGTPSRAQQQRLRAVPDLPQSGR